MVQPPPGTPEEKSSLIRLSVPSDFMMVQPPPGTPEEKFSLMGAERVFGVIDADDICREIFKATDVISLYIEKGDQGSILDL